MKNSNYTKKIMIVDDNQDILISLKELFELKNYEVHTAENGWQCIKELEKGFQGIIILDLMMPVMDGFETLKKMVLEGFMEKNSVIVLTAKRIQGKEFDEFYPHIQDFITKPFDTDYLLKSVEKIVK